MNSKLTQKCIGFYAIISNVNPNCTWTLKCNCKTTNAFESFSDSSLNYYDPLIQRFRPKIKATVPQNVAYGLVMVHTKE